MLSSIIRSSSVPRVHCRIRTLTQAAHVSPSPSSQQIPIVRHPYYVPRNSRGSLPVYTDIRNRNKYLILVRNVEGSIDSLVSDMNSSLFPAGSPEAERLKIETIRSRHVVLSGGNWKHDVVQWLQSKGF